MQYIKLALEIGDTETREMLIASLSASGFEGFEETETALIAYIPQSDFNENELGPVLSNYAIRYSTELIPEQNWNATWEQNFQPVIVENFCTVRAYFHTIEVNTPYEIVITPKMSFGTGHHSTTQLMMLQMRDMQLKQRSVLDFGTGTGILAILAEKLGAASIIAIDNDEWSYENALENIKCNNCEKINVKLSSEPGGEYEIFDIILANINRHILLENMTTLYRKLNNNGLVLMSGLLREDEEIIVKAAEDAGLRKIKMHELNNWIILLFEKI